MEESNESSDSDVDTDSEDYHVMLNKWLQLKDQNLRWENVAQKQTKLLEEVLEELAAVKEKNESLEPEVSKLREVAIGERERARMLERDLVENHADQDAQQWIQEFG